MAWMILMLLRENDILDEPFSTGATLGTSPSQELEQATGQDNFIVQMLLTGCKQAY
jgi:hypothetical protein